MSRPRRPWSKVVSESGVNVRLYERAPGTLLYREVRTPGGKDRRTLGHRDRMLAEQQARELARRLAELRMTGQLGPVTLGQVLRLYFEHRVPLLSAGRQAHAKMHAAFFRAHLGEDFLLENLSQTHVDSFAAARKAGKLRAKNRPDGKATVRDGTVRQNLNFLAAVLRWARGFKVGGRRLLASNPLDGVRLPQERNVRRPIASEDRYRRTIAVSDAVDPTGGLRCMLALARYAGRRVNAICSLVASDVLLSRDAVLRALAAGGRDEREADHMPHGAIRWRAEHDKLGYEELTPLSRECRSALDAYLRRRPAVGETPLFPDANESSRPIKKMRAEHLLARAERQAGLPHLERGLWHPYRRLWASERKALPDVDVAKAGGWRDLAVMKTAYQHADAATVLRVVENHPLREHETDSSPEMRSHS